MAYECVDTGRPAFLELSFGCRQWVYLHGEYTGILSHSLGAVFFSGFLVMLRFQAKEALDASRQPPYVADLEVEMGHRHMNKDVQTNSESVTLEQ